MDPRNLKRIQIFALVMNMAATLNAWLQSVALLCVQHRIRQWKLASEIFGPNSDRQSSEGGGVKTSQSKSMIRAKTAGDLVFSSQAMQFQWNCSISVPSVNGDRFGSGPV